MKPPRIPAYLKDAPLVWSVDFQAVGQMVGVPRVSILGFLHVVETCFWDAPRRTSYFVIVDGLIPLTETARQILAGEWR